MYKRNPDLLRVNESKPVRVEMDSSGTDGFISQLKAHLKVWEEPCLIRLSDILKKTKQFSADKDIVQEFSKYEIDSDECPHKVSYQNDSC